MPAFFEKFIFGLKAFSYNIRMGLKSDKAVDVTSEKIGAIRKVHCFDFLFSCLYTFNPLSLSLKWVVTLVVTTYRNMESRQFAKLPT